jgi:hypothetical protein
MASAHPIHPLRPALLTLLLGLALAVHTPAVAQTGGVLLDTVQAGRFDMGKMWTFEYAPVDYFTTTYGFQANQAWFDAARMAALRIPGCSAAFVSPNGLVVTNHHCVRGSIVRVTREGESLLDHGFYAASLLEERPIPSFYADQLVAAEDVSDEILTAMDRGTSDADRERIAERSWGPSRSVSPPGTPEERAPCGWTSRPCTTEDAIRPIPSADTPTSAWWRRRSSRWRTSGGSRQFHLPPLRPGLRLPPGLRQRRGAPGDRSLLPVEPGRGPGGGCRVRYRESRTHQPPEHRRPAGVPERRAGPRPEGLLRQPAGGHARVPRHPAGTRPS